MQKIAIIGLGYIGTLHAKAIAMSEKLKLAAVVDKNSQAVEAVGKEYGCPWYTDAEEMLKTADIDIVYICVPTFLHEEYVLLAARYKKHILCEKPVALSVESFDRMTEAVKNNNVKMMVAQVIRFWNEYEEIKKLYDEDCFGKIKLITARRLAQLPTWRSAWQKDPKLSGGGLYDIHAHDIDYLRYLAGPMDSVYTVGDKNETGCWNHVISSIVFKNGVKAVVEASLEMTEGYPFTMNLCVNGTECTAEYNMRAGLNIKDEATRTLSIFKNGEQPVVRYTNDLCDPYLKQIEYFAECCENNTEIEKLPLSQSREVLCLLKAAEISLETGNSVKL